MESYLLQKMMGDQGWCMDDIIENEKCGKMLNVNSDTKMLTKERKYSDMGSPWIYQLIYHSKTCCKRGSVKIKDNTLIK